MCLPTCQDGVKNRDNVYYLSFLSLLPQLIYFLSFSLVVWMYINWAACEATQFVKWVSSGLLVSFFCQRKKGGGVIFGKSWCGALSASWNFWLGQISPTIFWEAGIGRGVHENNAYCFLLRMAHLLIFIHNGGIWKGTIRPWCKNGTHFSCYESLPNGYDVQMSKCF